MAGKKQGPKHTVARPPRYVKKTKPPLKIGQKGGVFASFEDTDMGWEEVEAVAESLDRAEVEVGFFANHGPHRRKGRRRAGEKKAGLSVIARAAVNNFGTPEIPARPFMTVGFDRRQDVIKAEVDDILSRVSSRAELARSLRTVGHTLVMRMRQIILEWDEPGNARMTIAMKGFDDPLVWTSEMANAPIARYMLKNRKPKAVPKVAEEPKNPAVQKTKRGSSGRAGRAGGGWLKGLIGALNAQGARNLALRAPKKSGSKKATLTRFTPRMRFRAGGTAKRR